jgi:hypothetical protein
MFRAANRLRRTPYDEWLFVYAASNGNLENMKWLLENNFPYNEMTFSYAALNGNLENMKWLLENNFPYDDRVIENAINNMEEKYEIRFCESEKDDEYYKYIEETDGMENIKWLLENKFPYNKYSKKKLIKYKLIENQHGIKKLINYQISILIGLSILVLNKIFK